MKQHIAELISAALKSLTEQNLLPAALTPEIKVENTRDKSHGDYASNIALTLAKPARCNPREIAEKLVACLPASDRLERTEIAGPGFINFFMSSLSSKQLIVQILEQKQRYGSNNDGAGKKVQVEFVSANPTGPLHIGHGRGAAVGDSLCRILQANGWDVTREFYYNDAGQQINNLALSVQARCKGIKPTDSDWPKDGYQGDYIIELANDYLNGNTVSTKDNIKVTAAANVQDIEAIRQFAVASLRAEQDMDLQAFDVNFDSFFLESSLYEQHKVEAAVEQIIANNLAYEKDNALWLKTTTFGDDKDRVMRKKDGSYTYFVPDVAYHLNKWQRGFEQVINEHGADHHSTITRVRAGLQALDAGIPKGWPDYVLHQMVTVMRAGNEVKISKRAGSYLTLRDLIDEVGRDATRYFLVARKSDSHLTFDIDLARSESADNPVYYIQYAHARVCSIFRKLAEQGDCWHESQGIDSLSLLDKPSERHLILSLGRYPEVVRLAASAREPHQIANYLRDLAAEFHAHYNSEKTLVEDIALRNARLTLAVAVRYVLASGLNLLGVSAPELM